MQRPEGVGERRPLGAAANGPTNEPFVELLYLEGCPSWERPREQTGATEPQEDVSVSRRRDDSDRATATRTLRFASTYTGSVSDDLAVAVDCYAGSGGEETPRRFTFENRLVEIRTVVDQWRTSDHRYFRVRTSASESYTLRHHVKSGVWELTGVNVTPAESS